MSTPWKPGLIIGTKQQDYQPSAAEQHKYRDLGAMRLGGSLLWLARMGYPGIDFAAAQASSVMSMPSLIRIIVTLLLCESFCIALSPLFF
jgi:hypothetical protein